MKKYQKIYESRKLLELPERATMDEIKTGNLYQGSIFFIPPADKPAFKFSITIIGKYNP
jgi:hypothetical protein